VKKRDWGLTLFRRCWGEEVRIEYSLNDCSFETYRIFRKEFTQKNKYC